MWKVYRQIYGQTDGRQAIRKVHLRFQLRGAKKGLNPNRFLYHFFNIKWAYSFELLHLINNFGEFSNFPQTIRLTRFKPSKFNDLLLNISLTRQIIQLQQLTVNHCTLALWLRHLDLRDHGTLKVPLESCKYTLTLYTEVLYILTRIASSAPWITFSVTVSPALTKCCTASLCVTRSKLKPFIWRKKKIDNIKPVAQDLSRQEKWTDSWVENIESSETLCMGYHYVEP